ncbi:MAG: cation:proton antiporter [Pseudomonadota bacterium]
MKESLLPDVFLQAGLFFALGSLIIPVLRYFKIPTALGYLLAGIAVGPFGLGALSDTFPVLNAISLENAEHVKILAELSIIFLLFVVGLELTPSRLWQMRNLVFGLGGAQVIVSAIVIGGIAYLWGNSLQVAMLLGLGLALSSTAMVLQWLQEKSLFAAPVGKTSFSILLLQDLAVIPILFLLTIFSADYVGSLFNFVSFSLLKMVVAALLIYFVGRFIVRYVFLFSNKHGGPEVFIALSFLTIVVSASVAHAAGLSMALGAFIAGLLLADTEYRHEVSSFIIPFKSLLLGIFFFSFGMGIDLGYLNEKPLWLFLSVIGLMSIKAIIIFCLCQLWRQSKAISVESAILLSQAGEFGLLVVGSALTMSLIQPEIGQFMLLTIGATMIVTPVLAPLARKAGQFIEDKDDKDKSAKPSEQEKDKPYVVVFGYGRIGRNIGNTLCAEGFSVIGFDKKIEKVNLARKKSYPVYLGNAATKSTQKAAGLDNALCIVIAIDSEKETKKIVEYIREANSNVPIIVRAHNIDDKKIFYGYENIDVFWEDCLISDSLSKIVLELCRPFNSKLSSEPSS